MTDIRSDQAKLISCADCGKHYRIHPERLPEGVTSFNCKNCGALVRLDVSTGHVDEARDAPELLIVISEGDLAHLVVRILDRHGIRSRIAFSGVNALEMVDEKKPDAVLINVVLPDMMGYELIDRLNERGGPEKCSTILLSSLHHGTRYKRSPTSLYGADDHIERHHLPDMLVPKLRRLIEGGTDAPPVRPTPEGSAPPTDDEVQDRRKLEEIHLKSISTEPDPVEEDVRRMCRIIVADIALYNEDKLRASTPETVVAAISDDIAEGERLLKDRFQEFSGDAGSILVEEMNQLLASRGIKTVVGGDSG